jgi:hypothetical protein
MATRFSASEARLKAENVQKTLEVQRKKDDEQKKILAKDRALIKQGFENQKVKVISAAIDGQTEIVVDSIYLFRELLKFGIEVVEVGLVKKQNQKHEKIIDWVSVKNIKEEILEHFDVFIDAAKDDLKSYYGGIKQFHSENYDALNRVINSNSSWSEFDGDYIFEEEVPDDLKSKYVDFFEIINEKIKELKDCYEEFNANEDDGDYYDDGQLITGEYYFSSEDDEVDLLKPSAKRNLLKIRWNAEAGSTYMNDPLLSDVGLAWLSTYRGQNLIEQIFNSLNSAAEMGKTNLKLDFSLTADGWLFVVGSKNVFCCMPDELVEIIAREEFTIDDTTSTKKSYAIKVSW